jgi:hypothetical protein
VSLPLSHKELIKEKEEGRKGGRREKEKKEKEFY